jgi:hypothetical protein
MVNLHISTGNLSEENKYRYQYPFRENIKKNTIHVRCVFKGLFTAQNLHLARSGSERFERSDSDPEENRPGPQHRPIVYTSYMKPQSKLKYGTVMLVIVVVFLIMFSRKEIFKEIELSRLTQPNRLPPFFPAILVRQFTYLKYKKFIKNKQKIRYKY